VNAARKAVQDAEALIAVRHAGPLGSGAIPKNADRMDRLPAGIVEKNATLNGVRINYKIGGSGPVVVLLHGYSQTSHMWLPLMAFLATTHTIVAPDLRGMGESQRAPDGYDKKTMAKDIHELVHQLGIIQPVAIVGHDIGLMVAYASPSETVSDLFLRAQRESA
jgi:alpha/beta hydrolase fold